MTLSAWCVEYYLEAVVDGIAGITRPTTDLHVSGT